MQDLLEMLSAQFDPTSPTLMLIGIGVGVLILFYAIAAQLGEPDEGSRRLHTAKKSFSGGTVPGQLSFRQGKKGVLAKGFVPTDEKELSAITKWLRSAGYRGEHAVRNYFLIRTVFGLILPTTIGGLWLFAASSPRFYEIFTIAPDINQQQLLLIIAGLIAVGFYGPTYVIKKRIAERQLRITEGFPNALDLLQISVEAGLGFDAAMNRVADELQRSNPEIAEEFSVAQSEVSAGRDRERALLSMAERVGVTEVNAFVNVMLQSMEFGTGVSDALTTYAQEMRVRRELRAIEKANKLPVSMSATLVLFMLPALLTLVLSPIVISYIRIQPFGN